MREFKPVDYEEKWQNRWEAEGVAHAPDLPDPKSKYYMLMMFPYPSGDRLHVGHGRNYILGDALFRVMKMKGRTVLNPMGFDAFGLPAENAAIRTGRHPKEYTEANIAAMKTQFRRWGMLYDWPRELASCHPEYYRWNQWVFLKMYERGLAYRKEAPVNWCPSCATVLANEQVLEGCCERCDTQVEMKNLRQWFYRITQYADDLLRGIDALEGWPEKVRVMQRNWIGRSRGLAARFAVRDSSTSFEFYTTRPDTLYGVTYMALAPEHPLLADWIPVSDAPKWNTIRAMRNQSRLDREAGEKLGLFTGRYAVHALTGENIPIWVANFVLPEYGTGAIMCVPAHDQRDFEFAKKYRLPIKVVIHPEGARLDPDAMKEAFSMDGVMADSGPFSGLPNRQALEKILDHCTQAGIGAEKIQYRLRDWLISRQRYWGTPIPILYCEDCGTVPVPEADLPVRLPADIAFKGVEGNPLVQSMTFVQAACPTCGRKARRETDTMDTFVDSSWYFLRYVSPNQGDAPFDRTHVSQWLPVDQYIGGVEHAILHLLYARFYTRVLKDLGLVDFKEPFTRLFNQGMILKDGFKMSKSKGNVVNPDQVIEKYGADTQRVYTLFIGPPEKDAEWNDQGLVGVWRFLSRVWDLYQQRLAMAAVPRSEIPDAAAARRLRQKTHWTIRKVNDDLTRFQFNTAISAMMELSNELKAYLDTQKTSVDSEAVAEAADRLIQCLYPCAPHMADELWEQAGHAQSLIREPWPQPDPQWLAADTYPLAIQINGKLRGTLEADVAWEEERLQAEALVHPNVSSHMKGKLIRKVVHVPRRLLNLVVE